ncbi:hypothetical protein BY996DRAFT_4582765 [Phakopsora pachyrhizi]|nr:hypothetical protein BY996DRAFT_4582765 [Phakopsora pachyrhizi]
MVNQLQLDSELDLSLINLIPIKPSSISILDLIIPPILISLSILIYDLSNHCNQNQYPTQSSHLFYLRTLHSRSRPSSFNFSYRLIYFGLDLNQLESNRCDLPYLFRFYCGKITSNRLFRTLTSISPESYLYQSRPRLTGSDGYDQSSIRSKLIEFLTSGGFVTDPIEEVGRCYLITMPAYLNYETINPLSIHLCYHPQTQDQSDNRPKLRLVVLEVHNTFGERHNYVLEIGSEEEDSEPVHGFKHQWTVPRSFHVSPFNDRSGFYKISLTDPFSSHSEENLREGVKLKVRVELLDSERQSKFVASLIGEGVDLNVRNLIRGLISYPLSLLMTSSRILYQSAILHLGKPRLDAYPRPDQAFDPHFSSETGHNRIQAGGQIGSVGWQKPDWCCRTARRIVLSYLEQRVLRRAQICAALALEQKQKLNVESDSVKSEREDLGESFKKINKEGQEFSSGEEEEEEGEYDLKPGTTAITVVLRPSDLTQPISEISPPSSFSHLPTETLFIDYSNQTFFIDLITFQTPSFAMLVSSDSEAQWKPSSRQLFEEIFEDDFSKGSSGPSLDVSSRNGSDLDHQKVLDRQSWMVKAMICVRTFHLRWQLSFIGRDEIRLRFGERRSSLLKPPFYLPISLDESFSCEINPIDRYIFTNNYKNTKEKLEEQVLMVNVLMEMSFYIVFVKVFRFRFTMGHEPWNRLKRLIFSSSKKKN